MNRKYFVGVYVFKSTIISKKYTKHGPFILKVYTIAYNAYVVHFLRNGTGLKTC